jgi:hypothetical protein
VSVSNKVALYASLPALGILLYGIAALLIYQTTIEARVSILSSIATSVTVLFLISERLRESARHKLEFVNKKALTPVLRVGKGGIQWSGEGEASDLSKSLELLEHHGRFLRVRLYPKALLMTIEKGTVALGAYGKMFHRISEAGYAAIGRQTFNIWAVLVSIGLMDQGNYTNPMIDSHKQFFETLKTSDPEAYRQFPIKGKDVLAIKGEIKKMIEDFFIENQLEEVPEKSTFG